MLRKFVFVTGALDFFVGAGSWAGALLNPQPGSFVALITLGTFLMMAAACLMWASEDIETRAPVVFWQGLVRLSAAGSVLYAVPAGLSENWEYVLFAFDGPVGLAYVLGSMRVTGLSFAGMLACRPPRSATTSG